MLTGCLCCQLLFWTIQQLIESIGRGACLFSALKAQSNSFQSDIRTCLILWHLIDDREHGACLRANAFVARSIRRHNMWTAFFACYKERQHVSELQETHTAFLMWQSDLKVSVFREKTLSLNICIPGTKKYEASCFKLHCFTSVKRLQGWLEWIAKSASRDIYNPTSVNFPSNLIKWVQFWILRIQELPLTLFMIGLGHIFSFGLHSLNTLVKCDT